MSENEILTFENLCDIAPTNTSRCFPSMDIFNPLEDDIYKIRDYFKSFEFFDIIAILNKKFKKLKLNNTALSEAVNIISWLDFEGKQSFSQSLYILDKSESDDYKSELKSLSPDKRVIKHFTNSFWLDEELYSILLSEIDYDYNKIKEIQIIKKLKRKDYILIHLFNTISSYLSCQKPNESLTIQSEEFFLKIYQCIQAYQLCIFFSEDNNYGIELINNLKLLDKREEKQNKTEQVYEKLKIIYFETYKITYKKQKNIDKKTSIEDIFFNHLEEDEREVFTNYLKLKREAEKKGLTPHEYYKKNDTIIKSLLTKTIPSKI